MLSETNRTSGVMFDIPSSPNDPVFFNHHTMVDCIFEQWLENNPSVPFDGPTNDPQKAGHSKDDCITPFLPVYRNIDMFMPSSKLGYTCTFRALRRTESQCVIPVCECGKQYVCMKMKIYIDPSRNCDR